MTYDEVFEVLRHWAEAWGCAVYEADGCELPEEVLQARNDHLEFRAREGKPGFPGFYHRGSKKNGDWFIWIRPGLMSMRRTHTMGHELGHLAVDVLGGSDYLRGFSNPYAEIWRELAADLFGKCLVGNLTEDRDIPFLDFGGIFPLLRDFFFLSKDKLGDHYKEHLDRLGMRPLEEQNRP